MSRNQVEAPDERALGIERQGFAQGSFRLPPAARERLREAGS
jgi:hypothetical protein